MDAPFKVQALMRPQEWRDRGSPTNQWAGHFCEPQNGSKNLNQRERVQSCRALKVASRAKHGKLSCRVATHDMGDTTVPDVILSKLSKAKLSEKEAWQRYAEAKEDNWREAFDKWVEARDASMAAWADEVSDRWQPQVLPTSQRARYFLSKPVPSPLPVSMRLVPLLAAAFRPS